MAKKYAGIIRNKAKASAPRTVVAVIGHAEGGLSRLVVERELKRAWADWRGRVAQGAADDSTMRAEVWTLDATGVWADRVVADMQLPRTTTNVAAHISITPITPADHEAIRALGGDPANFCSVFAAADVTGGDVSADTITVTLAVKLPKSALADPAAGKLGLLRLGSAVLGKPMVAIVVQRSVLNSSLMPD